MAKYWACALRGSGQAATFGKALERVVADGVEQVIARLVSWERDQDDRLINQSSE